jgi:hypothetical protein
MQTESRDSLVGIVIVLPTGRGSNSDSEKWFSFIFKVQKDSGGPKPAFSYSLDALRFFLRGQSGLDVKPTTFI